MQTKKLSFKKSTHLLFKKPDTKSNFYQIVFHYSVLIYKEKIKTMKGQQQYDEITKFLIIGDSKVGKTSFIKSFCNGEHNPNQQPTNNLQYGEKIVTVSGKKVLFQIWDTPVSEKFRLIIPQLYSSVMGVLLVFSVDNRNSFNSVAIWLKQIQTFAPENIPIILVCNKADLIKKQVSQRQAQALSQAINIDIVMTSSKKQINIEQTMIKLYQKRKKEILHIGEKKKKQERKERFSIFKCNY